MGETATPELRSASKMIASRSAFSTGARMAVKANGAKATMSSRPLWLPGSTAPAHLTGTLPGDYGFDPLGLGSDATLLSWFKEAELQHCRWAMAGAAGILGQEIFNPSVNFFEAGGKVDLPMSVPALLGIQFALMHYVEIRRWQDWRKPNSVNQDPIFSNNSLPDHEPGYPGGIFAPVIPGDLEVLKVKRSRTAAWPWWPWWASSPSTTPRGRAPWPAWVRTSPTPATPRCSTPSASRSGMFGRPL